VLNLREHIPTRINECWHFAGPTFTSCAQKSTNNFDVRDLWIESKCLTQFVNHCPNGIDCNNSTLASLFGDRYRDCTTIAADIDERRCSARKIIYDLFSDTSLKVASQEY